MPPVTDDRNKWTLTSRSAFFLIVVQEGSLSKNNSDNDFSPPAVHPAGRRRFQILVSFVDNNGVGQDSRFCAMPMRPFEELEQKTTTWRKMDSQQKNSKQDTSLCELLTRNESNRTMMTVPHRLVFVCRCLLGIRKRSTAGNGTWCIFCMQTFLEADPMHEATDPFQCPYWTDFAASLFWNPPPHRTHEHPNLHASQLPLGANHPHS